MNSIALKRQILIFLALFIIVGGCRQEHDLPVTPVVVDSLKATFAELRQAAIEHDEERFFALIDPTEGADLQTLACRHGYSSLSSYIGRHFYNWPDLDTLNYRDL